MSEDWTAGGGGGGQAIDGNSNINSSNSRRRRINACQFCRLHATAVVAAATSHQTMMIFARICHQCCPPIRTETRFSCFLPLHISLLREWGREMCTTHFLSLAFGSSQWPTLSLSPVCSNRHTNRHGWQTRGSRQHTHIHLDETQLPYLYCMCVCDIHGRFFSSASVGLLPPQPPPPIAFGY